jgi:hypothetical protein
MYPKIKENLIKYEKQFYLIPDERKGKLILLSSYFREKIQKDEVPKLLIVSSSNSSRG